MWWKLIISGWLDEAALGRREGNALPTLAPISKAGPGFLKTISAIFSEILSFFFYPDSWKSTSNPGVLFRTKLSNMGNRNAFTTDPQYDHILFEFFLLYLSL